MIRNGEIKVNGQLVTEMGTQVEPGTDIIEYQGRTIGRVPMMIYVLLYKPAGFICSVNDPQGRPTVLNLLKDIGERIYPVGRLDFDTSGLLLLSNDGEFTNLMIHPRYKITKTYEARVNGRVGQPELDRMRKGLLLEDGMTAPAQVKLLSQDENSSLLEITIHEGRKRQIKRMCAAINHPVLNLKRTRLAFLSLQDMKEGEYRLLSSQEVEALKKCAGAV
jgi:pseudouridine synthase